MSETTFDEELGRVLASHRRGLSMSQEFLAEILRKDQTFISKVETGKRNLSLQDFIRWTKAMNLTPNDILSVIAHLDSHAE